MGRDHTLFSLVEGHVKFTTVERTNLPVAKGQPYRKPYKKFINVVKIPEQQFFVLKEFVPHH